MSYEDHFRAEVAAYQAEEPLRQLRANQEAARERAASDRAELLREYRRRFKVWASQHGVFPGTRHFPAHIEYAVTEAQQQGGKYSSNILSRREAFSIPTYRGTTLESFTDVFDFWQWAWTTFQVDLAQEPPAPVELPAPLAATAPARTPEPDPFEGITYVSGGTSLSAYATEAQVGPRAQRLYLEFLRAIEDGQEPLTARDLVALWFEMFHDEPNHIMVGWRTEYHLLAGLVNSIGRPLDAASRRSLWRRLGGNNVSIPLRVKYTRTLRVFMHYRPARGKQRQTGVAMTGGAFALM